MTDHPPALPHGPIEEIVDDIFWVQGSVDLKPGVRITRNMVIVRSGCDLTIVSPVRLSPDGEAALEKLGKVRHVMKIGFYHGMDDAYYLERFGAAYWALPGGTRPKDPAPDQELKADSLPLDDAELFEFRHTVNKEAALLVRRGGGVLITCDAVQHWASTDGCSETALPAIKQIGFRARPAQIGPPWLGGMTPEGGSLQSDFERLAELEFKHLIGGHGQPLSVGPKEALQATMKATF